MRLEILIGLPASGKSSYTKSLGNNYVIFSSDAIREELYGDENIHGNNGEVFSLLSKRLKELLSTGTKNAVIDATNVTEKKRKHYIMMGKRYGYEVVAIWFDVPLEVCLERNQNRNRP